MGDLCGVFEAVRFAITNRRDLQCPSVHEDLGVFMSSSLSESLFTEEDWCQIASSLSVSPRELQIIQGIFEDKKEAAIARQLGISPHTVHTYLERIYHKLAVNSRVQVVVRVVVEFLDLGGEEVGAATSRQSGSSGRILSNLSL
jgi:DNA-binding CsgD family transcriptional regulator